MMILLKLLWMLTHPWNKESNNDVTTTQRKIIDNHGILQQKQKQKHTQLESIVVGRAMEEGIRDFLHTNPV